MGPRITAGEVLSSSCILQGKLGALKEEINPSWEYKPCTTIPVFHSTRCDDWTVMENSSQERFQGSQLPILHKGCSYGFP